MLTSIRMANSNSSNHLECEKQMHSDFGDITNFGGPTARATAAGKSLEHFIDFDWIHIDIAGPSYLDENYRLANGSGFGIRLMIQFLKKLAN